MRQPAVCTAHIFDLVKKASKFCRAVANLCVVVFLSLNSAGRVRLGGSFNRRMLLYFMLLVVWLWLVIV